MPFPLTMPGLDDPIAALGALPALAVPAFILLSAALEYVFPPYWGDMLVLVGFFVAAQGATSVALVFLGAFAGSMLGAAIAYALGRRYGIALLQRVASRRRTGRAAERMQRLFRRFGERVLVLNRFLPVVRGLLLYGAGSLDLRGGRVLGYTALSNLAWLGLLLGLGTLGAETFEELQESFRHASLVLGIAALAVAGGWLAWTWWRARRGWAAGEAGP